MHCCRSGNWIGDMSWRMLYTTNYGNTASLLMWAMLKPDHPMGQECILRSISSPTKGLDVTISNLPTNCRIHKKRNKRNVRYC